MSTIPLCAPVAGLASIGHPTCQTYTPLSESDTPPLQQRIHQLQIDPGPLQQGYGEYIVFKQQKATTISPDKELFTKAYQVINAYAPYAITKRELEFAAMHDCANRYKLICENIRLIDPSLEVAFIPRTLYDTFLIRKCIQEDLDCKSVCRFETARAYKNMQSFKGDQAKYQAYLGTTSKERAARNCWHLCYFQNGGKNTDPEVQELAFRINQEMVKAFSPTSYGFTYGELAAFTEKEITFLTTHHENGSNCIDVDYGTVEGPTLNFRFEGERLGFKSMGIRNEGDAQIIREAVALECSRLAQTHLFLFRGANFIADASGVKYPTLCSLSYGTSLFAGCVFDPTATVFHYMRTTEDAFVIAIPYHQIHTSPFRIPASGAIVQFFNRGEFWHARLKSWNGHPVSELTGIWSRGDDELRNLLQSNLEKSEFLKQFSHYMNTAIHLRHPKCVIQAIVSKEPPRQQNSLPDTLRKRIFTTSLL